MSREVQAGSEERSGFVPGSNAVFRGGETAITRRRAVQMGALFVLGAIAPVSLSACGTSGTSGTSDAAGGAAAGSDAASRAGDGTFSFFVVSDSHISEEDDANAQKMREMFADLATLPDEPQAIAVNGDITNSGYESQYRQVKALAAEATDEGWFSGPFLWIMGNHDQFTEEAEEDDELKAMYPVKYRRFAEAFGLERCYYDTYIGGYHFIVLAPVNTTEYWCQFSIPSEELEWLDGLLQNDAKTGKPVFVFMHEPLDETLSDTFEGSWAYGQCAVNPDEIRACIERYPFVIFFSGHTHAYPHYALAGAGTAEDADAMNGAGASHGASGPLYAHDGCVKGTWKGKGGGSGTSNGLQVKVYEDAVEIRTRVFGDGTWDDEAGYRFERTW